MGSSVKWFANDYTMIGVATRADNNMSHAIINGETSDGWASLEHLRYLSFKKSANATMLLDNEQIHCN